MLPENGDEHEDRGNENNGEGDLGDWSRGERLDFSFTSRCVFFFMPSWESCQEEETYECKYDRNDARFRLALFEKFGMVVLT